MSKELFGQYDKFYRHFGDPTPELHTAYDSWLVDMASREGSRLVPFEFDLEKYPEQNIYIPKIDAKDPFPNAPDILYYAAARLKLVRSLGMLAHQRLLHQFNQQPVSSDNSELLVEKLINNRQEGKNTMVVTSHFTFPELGYFKVLRLLAEKNRSNISQTGVLYNKLMTRQMFNNKKLVDQFKPISNSYFSYPKSANAEKYGVPKNATMLGNALFMKVLRDDLEKGGVELDAALTGSQIIAKKNANNEVEYYKMPDIDPSSVKLIESFDDIFGATLIMSPITNRWEMKIGEVLDIQELLKTNSSAEIVDMIYTDIAKSVETFTKKDVIYSKLGKLAITLG